MELGLVGGWRSSRYPGAGWLTPVDPGLDERVALVTAGTRGIGRTIAEALAAEGARVAIAARSAGDVEVGGRGYVFDSADLDAVDI